jgi:hypothetical protein
VSLKAIKFHRNYLFFILFLTIAYLLPDLRIALSTLKLTLDNISFSFVFAFYQAKNKEED